MDLKIRGVDPKVVKVIDELAKQKYGKGRYRETYLRDCLEQWATLQHVLFERKKVNETLDKTNLLLIGVEHTLTKFLDGDAGSKNGKKLL